MRGVVACVFVCATGCGLESGGGLDVGSDGADAHAEATDAGSDAAPPPSCDAGALPENVLIVPDSGSCPQGSVENPLVQDVKATSGACSCAPCQVQSEASCAGNQTVAWGLSTLCGAGSKGYPNLQDSVCTDVGFGGPVDVADYVKWNAKTPAAGTCTSAAMADTTKLVSATLRTCAKPTNDALCAAIAAGDRLCIPSTGTCAAAFPVAVLAGESAQLTCSGCGCSRTSQKCVVDYYKDSACTQYGGYTSVLSGSCDATTKPRGIGFIKAHADAPMCKVAPATATVALVKPQTLCCNR